MRKSKAITLSLLGLGTGLSYGCGGSDPAPTPAPVAVEPVAERPADDAPADPVFEPDDTWFDADGRPIPTEWKEDADGQRVPAQQPYDRFGRPWTRDEGGNWVPPPPAPVRTSQLFGAVIVHGVPGGRSGGIVVPRSKFSSSVSRGGFGTTGGRIGAPST
jgi:hypothetical protein